MQVVGSFIIIFVFVCNLKYLYLFIFILFLKIGLVPFYYWSLYVVEKIEYNSFFFFLSLLKIIPFLILSIVYLKFFSISFFVALNCLVGSLGGLGSVCFRKIIFYSSLGHSGWILSCISIRDYLWGEYFFIYVIVFFSLIYIFFSDCLYNIKDIKDFTIKNFFVIILLLSLRGLPPFSVFIIKFYVIYILLGLDSYLLSLFLIISSLLRLYYYLRVSLDNYIFFIYSKILIVDKKIEIVYWFIIRVNIFVIGGLIFFFI